VSDERRALWDEVRAHLEWERSHGHAGIALTPPRPAPAASPERAPAGPTRNAPPASPPPAALPDEALRLLAKLRGEERPAGPASAPEGDAEAPALAPAPAPRPLPRGDKARLAVLADEVRACRRCRLHEGRTQTVFARGSTEAQVLFVGEAPGHHEDQTGEPFVGASGQLLDKMIAAMGLSREAVYVCNVVKCRPPDNRLPLPDEAGECLPYLREQIGIVAPRIIVALGRCAAENLGCALPGRSWRGLWGSYEGIPVMPTYHPSYLLRTPEMKRPVWEDLQKVMQRLTG
jgi:DNA polymerase